MKKLVLKVVAKGAEKAVKEASGSRSSYYFYEPEMPACLKKKKLIKNHYNPKDKKEA